MLASKRGVYLPDLVLVPKRQPGVQMDLNSSELPDEIKTMRFANIPANFVLEMHDIYDRDFTRYEIFYCSQK